MSSYRDFKKCAICRTKYNLKQYEKSKQPFEFTMLLNSMYMAVMYPLENRSELHLKSTWVAQYLKDNGLVNLHGNNFNSDDILRYLRNGLAHYNIEVIDDSGEISRVKIIAKNLPDKAKCDPPCENPKCIPVQYNQVNDAICTFEFTVEQLRVFTNFVIDLMLPSEVTLCADCKYKQLTNEN